MKKIASAVLALAVVSSAWGQTTQTVPFPATTEAPRVAAVFAKPERIKYDDKSLLIDGKPVFIFSGGVQYFRIPRELWRDRLTRMKEAGVNCVETYIAWSYHEREEPANVGDFSKLQHMEEINDFVQLARDLGLYVIIRPGPYICAEWDRGGLPEWLLKYKPANFRPVGPGGQGGFLRSSDPAVLQWDKHWYDAVAKIIKPHLVTNLPAGTPGVILWQIENEFDLSDIPPAEQVVVLKRLAEVALADGIDVPLFGCRTAQVNSDDYLKAHVLDSSTCYPGYDAAWLVKRIGDVARPQTDKFRAIPELQGGWFAQVGGKLSADQGYNAAQLNQVGMVAIEQGCTLVNYFVFHGGSQFGYGAAQNLMQSYDYDAPIREWGGVGERYLAAKGIGMMLKEHGDRLARATGEGTTIVQNVTHPDVHITVRKLADGTRYVFVRTDSKSEGRKGTAAITFNEKTGPWEMPLAYDLSAYGAKMLYLPAGAKEAGKGEWWPKSVAGPERPGFRQGSTLVTPVPVTYVAHLGDDMFGQEQRAVTAGQTFASLGINDTRYVEFRCDVVADAAAARPQALMLRVDSGNVLLRINGKLIDPKVSAAGIVPLAGLGDGGRYAVEMLFENNGYIHHTAALDLDKSVPEVSLIPADSPALSEWRMKAVPVKFAGIRPEVAADFDDAAWEKTSVTSGPNIATEATTAVFRSALNVTAEQLATGITLTLGVLDDTGEVYVNGTLAGANTTERDQHFSKEITPFLKPGRNVIAVVVANADQVGGLFQGAYVVPRGKPVGGMMMAKESQGVKEKFWELQPRSRIIQGLDGATRAGGLLEWYQMTFPSPAAVPGAWVPWHLHLEANVNGYVYFNGHNLGAYWAVGPQRDIYLPECWMMPAGQQNVVALQARPTSLTAPLFQVADVRPYTEFAEMR